MTEHDRIEQILEQIRTELVASFDHTFSVEAIRVDVDVLEGGAPLVESRTFDSLDVIQAVAAIEDHFDVSLAAVLAEDEPLTLRTVATHIAEMTG